MPTKSVQKNKRSLSVRFRRTILTNWQLYLFLLPAVSYFIIFHYIPMYGAQIAFRDFVPGRGIWGSEWVGLEHYIRFFKSYYFWRLLKNTIILSGYQLLLFPLPIIFALSLNELRNGPFKKSLQTISYAPYFISVVVVVGMIVIFTDPSMGMINKVISFFGGDSVNFLISPKWFPHIFAWSGVWQTLGWSSIIYLAALAGVNPELHEAARVDGANRLQRIRHVNIPAIMPTVMVLFILDFGSFMSVGFEKVLLMNNSLNSSTSDVIQTDRKSVV